MERKDYEKELSRIDKLEQKVAIKKANGMDTEADEFATEIAMLELVEKVATLSKTPVVSAEQLEVKRLFSEIKEQSKDSKEYCLLTIQLLKKYISNYIELFKTDNTAEMKKAYNLFNELTLEAYHVICYYCYENGVEIAADMPNIYESYPIMNVVIPSDDPNNEFSTSKFYESEKDNHLHPVYLKSGVLDLTNIKIEESIRFTNEILSLYYKLMEEIETNIHENNISKVLTLSSVIFRYSTDLISLSEPFE